MNTYNNIFLKNENKWIVADKEYKKVFASESKLEDLQKDIKKLKIKDAVILFVPPFDTSLAP